METLVSKKDTKNKSSITLGFSAGAKKSIVETLNSLLANYSVHYQKLRNYHWNVKGGDFFDLHEQFERQYNQAKLNIDEIAERIRVFDMTPLSTMRDYLKHSSIEETEPTITADEMVKEILDDYAMLLQRLAMVIKVAQEKADSGTEEMAKRFVKQIEKDHWMLLSFNQSGEE